MATFLHSEPRHLCSWWWDSHISPKNSKWMQENLREMDNKVRAMIKIINEDADSFGRRAEMYYKKRPELMKLVEDLYRAYRALAESYDHAAGELQLAHRAMPEVFPNQVTSMLRDDHIPSRTSVSPHTVGAFYYPEESDFGLSSKGLKQLIEMFQTGEATLQELKSTDERLIYKDSGSECSCLSSYENRSCNAEAEMQSAKEANAKMDAEKDAVHVEYRQCLELNLAQNGVQELNEYASEAHREMEHEITSLKEDALELRIHRLNEEIEDIHKKYLDLLQQVESAGIDPKCVRLSIEELRFENSRLEQIYSEEKAEREALLKKLEDMEERSCILGSYLSDVHIELESSKDKIKAIQESCDSLGGENLSLVAEKSALLCQLQIVGDSKQNLLEKNGLLEDSLCSASTELEGLRVKSKFLDDLCRLLDDEKSDLQCERNSLISQLEFLGKKVESVEMRFTRFEDTYSDLKGRQFARDQVDFACLFLSSEERLSSLEDRIHHLQEELRKDFEEELGKAVNDHVEIERLLRKVDMLSGGIRAVLKGLQIDHVNEGELAIYLPHIPAIFSGLRGDLLESRNETLQLQIQCTVLLAVIRQLSTEVSEYEVRKEVHDHEKGELLERTRRLDIVLARKEWEQEKLEAEVEALNLKQEANRCLQDKLSKAEEQKCILAEEIFAALAEAHGNLEHQEKENASLREANERLETEVDLLHEEIEAGKIRELVLNSELDERICDLQHWEDMVASYGFDLQMSAVREALFIGKVHELSIEIERMKDNNSFLESENKELESQHAAYFPVIRTLKNNIASLERNPVFQTQIHSADSSKAQEFTVSSINQRHPANANEPSCSVRDGMSELQDLQNRIETIDKALVEERFFMQEYMTANIKPEAAMEEIESCWSGPGAPDLRNETRVKDILLDHVSESDHSSSRTGERYSGPAKKASLQRQLEIAEYTDADAVEYVKELDVEKLEVPKEVTEVNDVGNGNIILESLSSDAQELESLNHSVQELKRKIKTNRKCNSTKAVEYTRLSGQLQDIDKTIAQLVDVNTKLMKTVKESPSSGTVDSMELVKAEQAEKRKVSRQASKEAERIGRLQLDVQKIQYLFLKLEEEKNENNKGKSRLLGSRTRVILSDFLYSHGSRSRKQRKVHICGCNSVDASEPHIRKFVMLDKSKSMQNATNLFSPLMR